MPRSLLFVITSACAVLVVACADEGSDEDISMGPTSTVAATSPPSEARDTATPTSTAAATSTSAPDPAASIEPTATASPTEAATATVTVTATPEPAATATPTSTSPPSTAPAVPPPGDRGTDIEGTTFVEPNLTVAAGTTVEWTNRDPVPHTVTFDNGSVDSGFLLEDQRFRHTFTTLGVVTFHCEVHPFMQARVTVQ